MRFQPLRQALALAAVLGLFSCADAPTAPELAPATLFAPREAAIVYPAVVISQVYGGGGNSGATFKNDFIELFNPGSAPVDLTGWRVGYASASGTSWNIATVLTGTIPAGGYYLIQQAAGTGGTVDLPTPNATGTVTMSGTAGKVILLNSSTAPGGVACPTGGNVVDAMGFGGSNCSATWGASTSTLSNTTAGFRANDGCAYTNPAVAADFTTGTPNPRNTSSPTKSCGGDVALPASVSVTPTTASVFVGASTPLTASALDADGDAVSTSFTWASSDAAIATVGTTGIVTGVTAGQVTITASSTNGIEGTATVTVTLPPPPAASDVVISQIYGGGGNSGAFYKNDYVELYNRGNAAADLTGWSVQYASAAGTSWTANAISGSIEPGKYYLIKLAAGTGGSAELPTPDATGSLSLGGTSGKIILSNAPTALTGACPTGATVVDRVGYGTSASATGCATEWNGRTANLSNTTAALRLNDGCINTGNAANDFIVLGTNPRNSASPRKNCTQPTREESAAQLQINELMGDPVNAESASWGEWFEVHNTGTTAIDLQGFTIITNGTSQPDHIISSSVIVPAGGYAVLGRGGDILRNGGVELDYNYFSGVSSSIFLDDSDFLMLVDVAGARVDSVGWTSLPRGIAKGLRPGLGPKADVNGADWAFATSTFGDGDYGTPDAENAPLSDVPPFVSPNRITFSGRSATDAPLPIGFESQVFASLLDGTGANISGTTTFTWTSLTPMIGSVDQRGVIRALGEGTARFRVTAAEGATRVLSLTFTTPISSGITYGDHAEFGLPVDGDASNDFLINRDEYTSSFDNQRGIPNFVIYNLTGAHIVSGADRCNCFTFDPELETAGFSKYTTADYTGAGTFAGYGIDRGHLARSFDRTGGTLDNARSFYFSNIIPQAADNNQGPWAQHENYLGDLARFQSKELWIHAGASGSIGTVKNEGRITIPAWTWKVSVIAPLGTQLEDVEDYRDLEVIAVVMPNVPGINSVNWQTNYVVTADSVEKLSGYRFLTALPANVRRALLTNTKPPIAKVVATASGVEGTPVGFDASASLDPNGTVVSYAWDFGDGKTGTGVTPSHTYDFFGDYTARVVLTDNDGLVDTAYVAVSVAQVSPAQGIAAVRSAITALQTAGTLNRGRATSLMAKVNAVEASMARREGPSALNQVGALRNELAALARTGVISSASYDALNLAIERLVRAID
jgi:DNA/RNA endonuclease G (NUC1)